MVSKHNKFSLKKRSVQNTLEKNWKLIILYSIIVILVATLALVSININKYYITGEVTKPLQIKTATPASINDKIIIYRGASSSFFLKYQNTQASNWKQVVFGVKGDQYLMGDWNGDGVEEIGLYRNYTRTGTPAFLHRFILKNANTQDATFYNIDFPIANNVPAPGDLAIVGDWDNDGFDTVGFYRPTQAKFFLSNTKMIQGAVPIISETYTLGTSNRVPVIGDWDGDGKDTIGVFNSNGAGWALRWNSNTGNLATFSFGRGTDDPISGDWDGDGRDNVGTYRRQYSTFSLSRTLINEGANNPPTFTTQDIITFGAAVKQDIGLAGKWIDCDVDDDGYESLGCGGNDCDDNDSTRYPGVDGDGDISPCENDCDDNNYNAYPGNLELCGDKFVDNDCDGQVDENCDTKCSDGIVRCLYDVFPQRCAINSNNQGIYVNEDTGCSFPKKCHVISFEEHDARALCDNGLNVDSINNARVYSDYGSLTFPSRVIKSDFKSGCLWISDRYFSIDTTLCPALNLYEGEKMIVSFNDSQPYQNGYQPNPYLENSGVMSYCAGGQCQNIQSSLEGVMFEILGTQSTLQKVSVAGGSGGGGSSSTQTTIGACCLSEEPCHQASTEPTCTIGSSRCVDCTYEWRQGPTYLCPLADRLYTTCSTHTSTNGYECVNHKCVKKSSTPECPPPICKRPWDGTAIGPTIDSCMCKSGMPLCQSNDCKPLPPCTSPKTSRGYDPQCRVDKCCDWTKEEWKNCDCKPKGECPEKCQPNKCPNEVTCDNGAKYWCKDTCECGCAMDGINCRDPGACRQTKALMNAGTQNSCSCEMPICGNGMCENGEDSNSCPVDCPSCVPKTCNDYSSQCGPFDDGCMGTIQCDCPDGEVCSQNGCINPDEECTRTEPCPSGCNCIGDNCLSPPKYCYNSGKEVLLGCGLNQMCEDELLARGISHLKEDLISAGCGYSCPWNFKNCMYPVISGAKDKMYIQQVPGPCAVDYACWGMDRADSQCGTLQDPNWYGSFGYP